MRSSAAIALREALSSRFQRGLSGIADRAEKPERSGSEEPYTPYATNRASQAAEIALKIRTFLHLSLLDHFDLAKSIYRTLLAEARKTAIFSE